LGAVDQRPAIRTAVGDVVQDGDVMVVVQG
jgi:hypothetical protein